MEARRARGLGAQLPEQILGCVVFEAGFLVQVFAVGGVPQERVEHRFLDLGVQAQRLDDLVAELALLLLVLGLLDLLEQREHVPVVPAQQVQGVGGTRHGRLLA